MGYIFKGGMSFAIAGNIRVGIGIWMGRRDFIGFGLGTGTNLRQLTS